MTGTLPHIVIVGAGFGGLSAARHLAKLPVRVTLIDRHNYHLFQPLLYQVACAALSPSEIATPIRSLFRRHPRVEVLMDEVLSLDTERKTVIGKKNRISYDYLVLAPGSQDSYFGHEEWKPHLLGLKTLADAVVIRQRLLQAFEEAEVAGDETLRQQLTTFVLVGAGPTGVEMAGAIAELARLVIAEEFRHVNPRTARIVLIEAGPRILSGFPPDLSAAAEEALRRKGVEVLTHTRVEAIDAEGVIANGQRIVSGNVLWSAGVAARPVAQWLSQPAETGRGGRVKVNPDLSLPGRPEIFVIGDAAEIKNAKGEILPGVAPVAKQQGAYVARLIEKRLTQRQEDTKPAPPFIYRDYGALATVGRYFAIADFRRIHLKGRVGWWLWGIAHIYYLIGFRNRLAVATSWLWEYLTYRRGSRLIITEDALPPSQRIHHATPPF